MAWLYRLPGLLLLSFSTVAGAQDISYSRDIQPIFDRHCLACHACYDAPCQLNLGSGEGLARGASKQLVYDGSRSKTVAPTRLYQDASTVDAWRQQGFFAVSGPDSAQQVSLMAHMLELGRQQPVAAPNSKLPDTLELGLSRSNSCPANASEFDAYAQKHPQAGMPYATTGLSDADYQTVTAWLNAGAPVDSKALTPAAEHRAAIAQWEKFLNQADQKHRLVARWLYEHLFLAHLYFEDQAPQRFYELVRSSTPAGRPIALIATATPNEDPGQPVYYRLRPVQGTLVHKTHITYPLSAAKLKRVRSLFFNQPWQVPALPGYTPRERSNPFTTFAAIPAQARYQFMLDNAEYFVRTFIRGPVCRGQIATDVIRDQFWALFQSPARDLFITDSQYRRKVSPLLALPGQKDDLTVVASQWLKYRDLRNDYGRQRDQAYRQLAPEGAAFTDIWDGDGRNDNALLTIFRHHDSASVRKGLIGDVPQTLWLMDYPLFERTYYLLVVNFNVFASVSHQAQTRLYFDLIRNGAEMNFLRLMPPAARKTLLADWYQGSGKLKMWLDYETMDSEAPTAMRFHSPDPKEEFALHLLQRLGHLNARPDPINRCLDKACARPGTAPFIHAADQQLSELSTDASQLPALKQLPEATLLRVYSSGGQREIYTLLRNRAHSNVAFMLGEDWRYQPDKDTLTVYPGVLASYPNFAFNVHSEELPAFISAFKAMNKSEDMDALAQRFGVRRTHPEFWHLLADYQRYMAEKEPSEAAVLDINRYQNL